MTELDPIFDRTRIRPRPRFDREREWKALTGFVTSGQPHATLGVVSGRWRQGKTFPLEALCETAGGFCFAADQATETESLRYFSDAIAEFTGSALPVSLGDGRQAVDGLLAVTAEREIPVVIDEFASHLIDIAAVRMRRRRWL
ncbi:hypothetical protein [Nocardia miyunensis]|uniref:hypothetical protein n=1 Tax=Nocardia miyunensis TaxID=282684 RepID=UPI000832A1C0|nr:hypothetical protein [Nocardia miyunensis]